MAGPQNPKDLGGWGVVVPEAASQLPVGGEGWRPLGASGACSIVTDALRGPGPLGLALGPQGGGPYESGSYRMLRSLWGGRVLGSDLPAPAGGAIGGLEKMAPEVQTRAHPVTRLACGAGQQRHFSYLLSGPSPQGTLTNCGGTWHSLPGSLLFGVPTA